jgi:hypothetical protein
MSRRLWLDRIRDAATWRVWILVHVLALALQWATIRSAPIVMQRSNGEGWYALCVTAKGP